ncbi:hypothetical protein NW765_000252 [Fusarium oxysporum]|nr:hypothetical protein NW765_000252 [Fusarium oxysporum]
MAEPEDIHARKPSGINIFGITGSGYHHLMPHEMADLHNSGGVPPSPEAKMSSPPETPHSFHNLLGGHHPAGSSSSSPRIADSQGTPEPYSEIWAPSMPRGDEKKDMPRTMEREVKMSEGGKLPKIVEPRGDAMDDEFDDEIL